MYQMPSDIIRAAIDEDADVIGVSYLSGEHLVYTPQIVDEMKKANLNHVLLVAGGVIPVEDISTLKKMGVHEVFVAGSLTEPIVKFVKDHVRV
jgi:methylmalonyl-CoA mutase C-terminal domain/subunit